MDAMNPPMLEAQLSKVCKPVGQEMMEIVDSNHLRYWLFIQRKNHLFVIFCRSNIFLYIFCLYAYMYMLMYILSVGFYFHLKYVNFIGVSYLHNGCGCIIFVILLRFKFWMSQ